MHLCALVADIKLCYLLISQLSLGSVLFQVFVWIQSAVCHLTYPFLTLETSDEVFRDM